MASIDEFKSFVKTKPSLISYVRDGDMTWQKFYELWSLYGAEHEVWNKYGAKNIASEALRTAEAAKSEHFNWTDLINNIKKLDMETIRQNLVGVQKVLGVVQEMTGNSSSSSSANDIKVNYNSRPMYKRFED